MSGADVGRYQWLVDDQFGDQALGGFYFCEVDHEPGGWIAYIQWLESADEATRFFDPSVSWLPPPDSEEMMALVPVQSARLERLINEDRTAELLERESLESIAQTWVRYHNTESHSTARLRDWWAIQIWLGSALLEDEDRRREGLLRLVDAAQSDNDFGIIGAGPLEDFIDDNESRLSWIEAQAQRSASFRRALAGVWIWTIPEDAFLRVERAAGVQLPRPGT